MEKETVTLVAALAAGVFSILGIVITVVATRSAQLRRSYRDLLSARLEVIGPLLHGALACCDVWVKRATEKQPTEKWKKKASAACRELSREREKSRYLVWGLDEGLRVLGRLASWISHYGDRPNEARELLNAADELRKKIDVALIWAFDKGLRPSQDHCDVVTAAAEAVREVWDRTNPHPTQDVEAFDEDDLGPVDAVAEG